MEPKTTSVLSEQAQTLLRRGGEWLASVRNFVKTNCVRGDTVIWGSNDPLHDISPARLLEIAARCVASESGADISKTWDMIQNPKGPWVEEAKTWILKNTGVTWQGSNEDRTCFKTPLSIKQVEEFAAEMAATCHQKTIELSDEDRTREKNLP